MKKFSAWIALFLTTIIASCGSIKSIHEYSSAATEGSSQFNQLHYSFQQSCLERCRLTAVRNLSIRRDTACTCTLYQRADSTTELIYNALISYLINLNTLSSKDLTTYNLDALQLAISYGDFAPLNLTDQQVNAYMTLSRLLLHATDLHRIRKLRLFIAEANPSFQTLVKTLQFILRQNLKDELNFKKESLFAYYKEMSLSATLSDYDKSRLVQDYYDQLSDINLRQKKIEILADLLSQVATGHQQIADHIHDLSSGQLKSEITQNATDIESLASAFKALK